MPASIFIVEDDIRLAALVGDYLESNGFRTTIAELGGRISDQILDGMPDLVILDLGLPCQDGFSICRQLRPAFANPILILTARDNDIDHVLGLELGADDYVVKPVEPRVLLARVHALLRRSQGRMMAQKKALRFGRLTIDGATRSVTLRNARITLSGNEFDLLAHLAAHAGQIQSREALFRQLYRREYDGVDRMLDIRISHLRRKLGEDGESSQRIKTIWGHGYLFAPGDW